MGAAWGFIEKTKWWIYIHTRLSQLKTLLLFFLNFALRIVNECHHVYRLPTWSLLHSRQVVQHGPDFRRKNIGFMSNLYKRVSSLVWLEEWHSTSGNISSCGTGTFQSVYQVAYLCPADKIPLPIAWNGYYSRASVITRHGKCYFSGILLLA